MSCYSDHRPKRLSEEERVKKKEARRKYKTKWFQEHKAQINAQRKNWKSTKEWAADKEWARNYRLKSKYNLTFEQYEQMLVDRDRCCDICGYRQPPNAKKQERLWIDHCHTTNSVRGLLCFRCNLVLGYARDNPVILDKAKQYLERTKL
jgi:hypothetical protein